ncbi:MAG: UDP-N-acetylglucosamine 2-epimerase (hydrolyzing) [Candidatus Omnitrophica bacterium]|nr:UDP-N-acetylglucosamine 2-epimerase (hydrolyzing) [Candidatus Omnitrophota bacterium]
MVKRKICVFTGSRAEYGLLFPLLNLLRGDQDFVLQLMVSGMHVAAQFGDTYRAIAADGFPIRAKIDIELCSDTPPGICRSIGLGVERYAAALARLRPEVIVILGDRFEAFAAATAAMVARIPIAHIHGGEATWGSIDEPMRHAITKMSALHFTSTEEYRRRVIQLGERPGTVFNVGALGIDNIRSMDLLSKEDFAKMLGVGWRDKNLLVTFHPVTLEKGQAASQIGELLAALESFPDIFVIFTKANADTEGQVINQRIAVYARRHRDRCAVFASLGQRNYLSALRQVDGVVGNSSSGIIEAPSFQIGTINIGDRQQGRVQARSVINCPPRRESIVKALRKLYTRKFQAELKSVTNPYDRGGPARQIWAVLRRVREFNLKKVFYDLPNRGEQ